MSGQKYVKSTTFKLKHLSDIFSITQLKVCQSGVSMLMPLLLMLFLLDGMRRESERKDVKIKNMNKIHPQQH